MLYFFIDPVLWSQGSQISAEKISAKLEENDIDRMFMDNEAFIISSDSIGNYNQIKGRNMVSYFDQGYITKVDVEGNGQTIYFAVENDTALIGMNRINCSNMVVHFADSNESKNLTFITKPESKFIPPHEITEADTQLKNFRLRFDEAPDKGFVYRRKNKLDPIREEDAKVNME
jgi:hypothetical protein